MPGNLCSSCKASAVECTYVETAKKRGPPKGYIASMETRIQKIERLLQTLLPEADLAQLHSESSTTRSHVLPPPDEDERAHLSLIENLQRLSLSPDRENRFFGRSSGAMLLQTALNVKLDAEPQNARRHTEFWASRRSREPTPPPQYVFPPPDLAASLVDLYFSNVNLIVPLLHRPTFDRDLSAGLHLTTDGFAATYLLVCAVGARYSSDARVLLDGTNSLHSCGWRWFKQLQLMRDPLGPPVCLYDLQLSALAVIFIHGTSAPQASWTIVSTAIRMAQDVGAHRRKAPTHSWTAEDELWKRAFWVLVLLDRIMSAHFGRPCAIQDEDFDLDFPIDCDDEYWDSLDPAMAFQQPKGKPSRISAFIAFLRLCHVLSFALRTIYSINKSKTLLGLTQGSNNDWEQRIVVELDSALNKWFDGLPDHLRWNPAQEQADFFEQSVALHCAYYHLQIIIHRPYIPKPEKRTPLAFPSLAICLNAARSSSRVLDIYMKRTGDKPLPLSQTAVFTAGLVLLLSIWAGNFRLTTDSSQEMAEVQRCMQMLQACEKRWHSAGQLWDILYELASVGQLPLPASATKNKRERGAEQPKTSAAPPPDSGQVPTSPGSGATSANDGTTPREPRLIAGRRRSTIDVPVLFPSAFGSHPSSLTEPPISGVRRLRPSDVPAITTEFLPHIQHRLQGYRPDTPSSSSSLHGRQHEEHGNPYARGPDTALSTTSLHSQAFIPSMQRSHGPLETPLSVAAPHPTDVFVPSMRREEHHSLDHARDAQTHSVFVPSMPSHDFAHSRAFLDRAAYWHETTSTSPESMFYQHVPNSRHVTNTHEYSGARDVPGNASGQGFLSHRGTVAPTRGHDAAGAPSENVDQETMAVWSAAPIGFELEDWGSYLDTVNQITQARMQ
ncbi:fungal-specific transcription factor domain-containing protein [Mycena pura]|uniref:Fungal-specific transcription factor domain-containing protein n=1 Tax=Mycena pura TaxID=153505 RepID=A0AAD7E2Q1_9AGAR|nr:fungal-specific transcription factor domain-containing protein [Mycena pura]